MGWDKVRTLGRRNFLEALAGVGVSMETLRHLTKEDLKKLTDDPTDQVPRLSRLEVQEPDRITPSGKRPPEREPVFYTIPRDEWAYTEAVHDAADQVSRLLSEQTRERLYDVVVTTVSELPHPTARLTARA